MDVREKLVEIERAAEWFEKRAENTPMPMARKMFELAGEALREKANGVTVQEWISVKDRLPKNFSTVVGYEPGNGIGEVNYEHEKFEWADDEKMAFVTHWMPLPQPPKGE